MVRLIIAVFVLLSSCAPTPFECDEEARRTYPYSVIETIDSPTEQIYVIDGKDIAVCNTATGTEGPYLRMLSTRPWLTAICRRLCPGEACSYDRESLGCPAEKE